MLRQLLRGGDETVWPWDQPHHGIACVLTAHDGIACALTAHDGIACALTAHDGIVCALTATAPRIAPFPAGTAG